MQKYPNKTEVLDRVVASLREWQFRVFSNGEVRKGETAGFCTSPRFPVFRRLKRDLTILWMLFSGHHADVNVNEGHPSIFMTFSIIIIFFLGQPTSTPFGFHTRPTGTSCGVQQYVCKNLRCVDKAQICNFKNDCGDKSDELPCGTDCTFEDDCYKGWRQSTGTDNFNWRRKNGKTPSVGTGPSTDHTLKTAQVHETMSVLEFLGITCLALK